jgi:hypothetical protein
VLIGCAATLAACARQVPSQKVRVGHLELKLSAPRGWEHLDHGRQQLFRNGEAEIALEDFGPVTPEGLERHLLEAQGLWLAGRRRDAFASVQELHAPPLDLVRPETRAAFWRPWYDVTYALDRADSAEIGMAFESSMRAARALPEVPPAQLVELLLARSPAGERSEIAHWDSLKIHGAPWLSVETWNRVSHMGRGRLACLEHDGYLLLLTTRRGLIEQTGAAFDSLLASIEVIERR